MKKIVGTIAAIALAASSAFAGVNVGMGFSRAIWTPFAYDGEDARMDISTSWGAAPRIGGSISGSSDDCGVVGDFRFDKGTLETNDNAYVWVKPISWLTINIGQSFDDTLRGNACFGMWDWLRMGGEVLTGEDLTFTRITGGVGPSSSYLTVNGVIVKADPIEGLHIAVAFKDLYTNRTFEDVFADIQVAAGYTIDSVGTIKAQWIGLGKDAEDKVQGNIEAAFALAAVEGMTLDIGARFCTVEKSNIVVSVYWSMPFDALRVNASAQFTIVPDKTIEVAGVSVDVDGYVSLIAGVGVDYDLGNGLSVGGDLRFGKSFAEGAPDPSIGFGVYLNKGIANGTVGVGAEGALRTQIRDFTPLDDFTFAVPVRVQCFF